MGLEKVREVREILQRKKWEPCIPIPYVNPRVIMLNFVPDVDPNEHGLLPKDMVINSVAIITKCLHFIDYF